MTAGEREVLLVIADISGYTRFIATNRDSLTHSQIIITQLMRAVLKELKVPLRVSKLEGDAVFFYLSKEGAKQELARMKENLRARIDRMFAAFDRRIAELIASNTCPCAGCTSVQMLRLKMVVHSGSALFYRLDRFAELSGFDVILVHRLLKNSVAGDEYVLLSEAARNDLFAPEETMFEQGEERYDDVGTILTFVYRPRSARTDIAISTFGNGFQRWKTHQMKKWSALLMGWGFLRTPTFQHLPDAVDTSAT